MLGQKQLRPKDVLENSDGKCTRPFTRYKPDGQTYVEQIAVCERCWEQIPVYVSAPAGWVSPDSGRKTKTGTEEGKAAIIAVQKVVCYDCLREDHLDMFGVFDDIPHEVRA